MNENLREKNQKSARQEADGAGEAACPKKEYHAPRLTDAGTVQEKADAAFVFGVGDFAGCS